MYIIKKYNKHREDQEEENALATKEHEMDMENYRNDLKSQQNNMKMPSMQQMPSINMDSITRGFTKM